MTKKGVAYVRERQSGKMALGGVMAALAVVIMCLGGMIPASTFACPMLSMMLLVVVFRLCGKRVAWAWYGSVAILSLLMGPDKEAAAVFVFLGYYPIIKSFFDRIRFGWILKFLYFNVTVLTMYSMLIHLFGMNELADEYRDAGTVMTVILLIMGNVIFFLLDRTLDRIARRRVRGL